MAKKKTTKVHQTWKGTKQVIDMGEEVLKENLEANKVYSVLMLTKGEGHLNYDWGIIITKADAAIVRNWNINVKDDWDANNVRLRQTWRVFPADKVSRLMALNYVSCLSLHKNNMSLIENLEALRDFRAKHWWRRV